MTATPPPTGALPPTPADPAAASGAHANIDRATAITEELIDRGAPWSASTTWTIVLVEGIVAVVLGVIFVLRPFGGSSTALQLVGIALLAGSLVTAFQLWRQHIRPDLRDVAAFRAGSGATVGLSVLMAAFLTTVTEAVTAALAVVVGIGFFVFGLSGIAASFVRRQGDAVLPVVTLILNAVLAAAGLILAFAGIRGSSTVDGIFFLLGIAAAGAGAGLVGYAVLLRREELEGVRR